jgi:2-keto-4-pentenoate hydratase/2-oxohepta-3-ene-1,7-dioic acid hydratase in catechol pathway
VRIANLEGRLSIIVDDGAVDVAEATADRFSAEPAGVYPRWDEFQEWARQSIPDLKGSLVRPFRDEDLGPPSPRPAQVFAIGANYREHLEETQFAMPKAMEVFSKFPTAITGPYADLPLPTESVDWEAELVVVIGRVAHQVPAGDAWQYVAGLTVGQDFSERPLQLSTTQWGLAKSFPAFGPTGPFLATVDELADPDDVSIVCSVNGEQMQKGRTGEMIFSVPEIVAGLTRVCTLLPGDLIFTGTMGGVGLTRTPPRYLKVGDEVVTRIDGIGELRNRCIDGNAAPIQPTTTGGK